MNLQLNIDNIVGNKIPLVCSFLQCLLVKGWKAGASWSFPRGKKSKDEEDHTCAVREVNILHESLFLITTQYVTASCFFISV